MCTKDIIVSTARQNFKDAEKTLRECDDIYTNDIKRDFEKMHIGKRIVKFVGVGKAEPITANDISFYLAQSFRVYVDEKQIHHAKSKQITNASKHPKSI